MELHFASRMKDYEEGIFQVLNEKKNELERQGRKVYNLSVGTPDFKPQQRIIDAVVSAAGKPENYKYALRDLPELTDAVISRYQRRYGVQLEPEEIMGLSEMDKRAKMAVRCVIDGEHYLISVSKEADHG